ncbi:hypothetical protein DPMN_139258 [Dreissena polymorpha]|uniref:Uncharacterized protein n=1 Tax=Dreissena polymorpha TaxID=45954 RepID=A0A9D4JGC8_DREPO|nr:hypothetical protein DPMN_139258 [Dreissena polymorpha]
MGDISTVMQKKRLSISRGHTHIGLSSASTNRHHDDDRRYGEIFCTLNIKPALNACVLFCVF